jgi:MerR family transcriptional regulator, copper efflux regulator
MKLRASLTSKNINYKLSSNRRDKVKKMNIGKAASLSGLTVKTVRYYSDIGIINPQVDVNTGYRDFSEADLAKIQFLAKARKFDFSLDDCKELLALYENKERSSKEVKALTLEKISEINFKLAELQMLKGQLSKLASDCQGNDRPNCPILDALSDKDFQ